MYSNKQISFEAQNQTINSYTIMNFQTLLKKETWESVYKDLNHLFNSFLCTFLNIF